MILAVSHLEIGNGLLGLLIAGIGYVLRRKSNEIHVLVNSRYDDVREELQAARERIVALEEKLKEHQE